MTSELSALTSASSTLDRKPVSSAAGGSQKNVQPAITDRPVDGIEKTVTTDGKQTTAANMSVTSARQQTAIVEEQISDASEQGSTEQEKEREISASEVKAMLDEINSALYSYNRALKFELHEKTDDLVVRVLNTKTDEIIRQYPSEEVLARKARLLEGDTHFFSAQVS